MQRLINVCFHVMQNLYFILEISPCSCMRIVKQEVRALWTAGGLLYLVSYLIGTLIIFL